MKNLPYSLFGYLGSFLWLGTMICSAQQDHSASQIAGDRDVSAYRVSSIQSDPVLGKRWAMLISCEHSEWPAVALPIDNSAPFHWPQCPQWASSHDTQSKPMVHIGEAIRAWKHENLLRIEVAGVAEEDGGLGQKVRVRIQRPALSNASPPEHLSGTVRGPGNVEIQP
jgi:Chaperone for flagella basal body P-ring formation